jgi:SAM-dependent methyltransferase
MPDLSEASASYRSGADAYDLFSRCEDAPGLVSRALADHARVPRALDLGCGSGKFTGVLADAAGRVAALDAQPEQLARAAARHAARANVDFVRGDACALPFADAAFDLVTACWMLGTVAEGVRRDSALSEMRRVLAPGGSILLVENAAGGAFEALRGRSPGADPLDRTGRYNGWLEAEGFAECARVDTRFEFPDLACARDTFSLIWGAEVGSRVASARICHPVALYRQGP